MGYTGPIHSLRKCFGLWTKGELLSFQPSENIWKPLNTDTCSLTDSNNHHVQIADQKKLPKPTNGLNLKTISKDAVSSPNCTATKSNGFLYLEGRSTALTEFMFISTHSYLQVKTHKIFNVFSTQQGVYRALIFVLGIPFHKSYFGATSDVMRIPFLQTSLTNSGLFIIAIA